MRIVALITVRNEERYMERCIKHLNSQNIEMCIIDNGSTDRTLEIVSDLRKWGVTRIEKQEYNGFFSLVDQCRFQEYLAQDIGADWYIHHDADEIRESDLGNKQTLHRAITDIDSEKFSAINFDEFVFIPTDNDDVSGSGDFIQNIKNYYYFSPTPLHRVNAWKHNPSVPVDLTSTGGHAACFEGRSIAERALILRHYIVFGASHASEKYGSGRVYDPVEMSSRGWHRSRAAWRNRMFRYPGVDELKSHREGQPFDKSDPKKQHLFWI